MGQLLDAERQAEMRQAVEFSTNDDDESSIDELTMFMLV
jgi:hypothetical protein